MDKDRRWLDKLIKKASSMVRRGQDNVETVGERWMRSKVRRIPSILCTVLSLDNRAATACNGFAAGPRASGDPSSPQPSDFTTPHSSPTCVHTHTST